MWTKWTWWTMWTCWTWWPWWTWGLTGNFLCDRKHLFDTEKKLTNNWPTILLYQNICSLIKFFDKENVYWKNWPNFFCDRKIFLTKYENQLYYYYWNMIYLFKNSIFEYICVGLNGGSQMVNNHKVFKAYFHRKWIKKILLIIW